MLRSNSRGIGTMDVQVAAEEMLRDVLTELRETMTTAQAHLGRLAQKAPGFMDAFAGSAQEGGEGDGGHPLGALWRIGRVLLWGR